MNRCGRNEFVALTRWNNFTSWKKIHFDVWHAEINFPRVRQSEKSVLLVENRNKLVHTWNWTRKLSASDTEDAVYVFANREIEFLIDQWE